MSVLVLLNAKAGALNTGAVTDAIEVVEAAFRDAGRTASVELVEPEDMDARLEQAARSTCNIVIVGGGDGTFSHALAKLSGSGKVLGLLPLGTMNLMGRDLYPAIGDLAANAAALAKGEIRKLDLARINGRPFHTLCGLGYFARVAREREQTRFNFPGGRVVSVLVSVWRSVTKAGRTRLDILADDRRIRTRAYATLVTANRIGEDWRRAQLDEGLLELHLMRASHFSGRAKAGLELLSGRWREGDTIENISARRVEIRSERPRMWIAVDGELRREDTPLVFEIERQAVPMLLPRRSDETQT
ncbi:multidrug transporter [Terrihabitans soli]|uniref:Multidrug transporter n=1 Tax=Terrihabitans soli TaxID=708113 RepID=A0A6S6QNI1_9HYPH|nr:diacylglycerol kinase family protein [Terrihabitans soli]BCJ89365.1 multidrug transporter [Terrihabitans soli]